jgi:ribonuclease Z
LTPGEGDAKMPSKTSEADDVNNNLQPQIRVTLLGTGAPTPVMERFGPATLVQAGSEVLLFDAGRGVLQRLFQLQPPIKEVRNLFLTHLHSDHVVGLPDLWLTGWLNGRPETPLRVRGPRGTKEMMTHLDQAFQFDIRIRLYDDRVPPEGVVVIAEDITEGIIYQNNGVTVTAFEVDHLPIQPAFGYRIDFARRSVVLSGDTRVSERLIAAAQGADLVIHEVIAAGLMRARPGANKEYLERVIAHHTSAEEAGRVLSKIQPRMAVFSHVIPVTARAADVLPEVRKEYGGPFEVGDDRMVINVGEQIVVERPSA